MIDVAVLGRVGIDLYPNQLRTPLREVRTYTRPVPRRTGKPPRQSWFTRTRTLAMAGAGGVGGTHTVVPQVRIDRRAIAEVVGRYTADKLARR